ncbi:MAG: DegT/DnrJ/EryC1/StrS family aminotransferase [Sedimentisphaerales bacterium]|nr:DegT/DnrJ/EryC1/StrS family aminotransferase [Sedimentisphaerales bacterium]
MKVNLSGPDVTQAEIDAVVEVMRTPNLSLGPKLGEFETAFADYIGRKYAVAVNSGTSGLHLCMLAYGIGPGDEVITTPFSFISTTNCVLMVGARPVFVDIDPETYNIDADVIEAKIGPRTKAILPVEVFGNPAGMDKVYEIARKHNLICVEDSCEGLGSVVNGKKVGTLGHASTFAFYPNKQMTTGEGGIILTDDEEVALMCGSLRNQGRDLNAGWLAHARLGYNYRLSDINCALGIVQLSRMEEIIRKRRKVFECYKEVLADERRVVCPVDPEGCEVNWFVYVVRLADKFGQEQRDKVLEILRGEGIGCSNYFSPIHLQPFVAEQLGCGVGDFAVTERVAGRTIALPFYNNLTRADVETVSAGLRKAIDEVS